MRCITFRGDAGSVDAQFNNWAKENPHAEIKFMSTTCSGSVLYMTVVYLG